jgi:dienelactone hydrolase
VKLELASGKTVDVELDKLAPADRKFALDHFGIVPPKEGDPVRSTDTPIRPEGQPHPVGKVSGPFESDKKSHYYLYIPKSLREGRKAPVLHYNGSGGGKPEMAQRFIDGCERFGWILAISVESSNKAGWNTNLMCANRNVIALKANPLVDPARIYYTGQSGGGATSWLNYAKVGGAGTMPVIGYILEDIKIEKGHHFIMGGATDWNRYHGGRAAAKLGKAAFYRIYPGGHSFPKDDRIFHEGIAWLTGRYLADNASHSSLANERLDYEAAMIDWINEMSATDPGLACHLAQFLKDTYRISGRNATILDKAYSKLRQNPQNTAYAAGVREIHEFGATQYGTHTFYGQSQGINNPAHAKSLERLAARFRGVPFVEETLLEMAKPTQKGN